MRDIEKATKTAYQDSLWKENNKDHVEALDNEQVVRVEFMFNYKAGQDFRG